MKTAAQIEYTPFFISIQRCIRYLRVGCLLHLVAGLGMVLFLIAGPSAIDYFKLCSYFKCLVSAIIALWGVNIVFFSQCDAFSRFQNYKLIKDLFYENGFDERIAGLFTGSKCQRDALMTAAHDLKCVDRVNHYLRTRGYKWFHLIPDILVKKPVAVFSQKFWQRTLFEKTYHSKYFLW